MKIIVSLLWVLCSSTVCLGAPSAVTTIVDYLKETPASVSGNISLDQPLQLYQGKYGIIPTGMRVNANKNIGFSFSENYLQINSEKGIDLTFAGYPVKIKQIYFHEQTGKFQVSTDTPLGIFEKSLNTSLERMLTEHYKSKVTRAFGELKSLRSKNKLQDVNQVIKSITKIFATGQVMTPTVRGNMELSFNPKKKRRLKLDVWNADIRADDNIAFGMNFVQTPDALVVKAVEFSSYKGIRFTGKTNFPEIASVELKHLKADSHGIHFNYSIGAEEVIAGFQVLIAAIGAYNGHPANLLRECDPVRLNYIRNKIDGNLRLEIASMIRKYRKEFLAAGASPQLLAALD